MDGVGCTIFYIFHHVTDGFFVIAMSNSVSCLNKMGVHVTSTKIRFWYFVLVPLYLYVENTQINLNVFEEATLVGISFFMQSLHSRAQSKAKSLCPILSDNVLT